MNHLIDSFYRPHKRYASLSPYILALACILAFSSGGIARAAPLPTADARYVVHCTGNDDVAINGAIARAIRVHRGDIRLIGYCLMKHALMLPYSGGPSYPMQQPIALSGEGAAWNGYWGEATNHSTVLDLRYDGKDGAHPAKIDTRGAGHLEISGLTLKSGGTDNLPFIQTTNTTVYIHDNAIVGNHANMGENCTQDFLLLGSKGYIAQNVGMTARSRTLTIAAGNPRFTPKMVGWNLILRSDTPPANKLSTTIAAYISPTQVTLKNPAPENIIGTTAHWYHISADPHAPFQGYGSVIARNYYEHIRHGIVWGVYANGVAVEDETYSSNNGADRPNGAPYLFIDTPEGTVGNIIRGGTVEMVHYAHLIDIEGFSQGNTFIGLGGYDGGTSGIYLGTSESVRNTIIPGYFDQNLPYVSGPGKNDGNRSL